MSMMDPYGDDDWHQWKWFTRRGVLHFNIMREKALTCGDHPTAEYVEDVIRALKALRQHLQLDPPTMKGARGE